MTPFGAAQKMLREGGNAGCSGNVRGGKNGLIEKLGVGDEIWWDGGEGRGGRMD